MAGGHKGGSSVPHVKTYLRLLILYVYEFGSGTDSMNRLYKTSIPVSVVVEVAHPPDLL